MKNVVSLLIVLAMGVGMLAGCGSSSSENPDTTTSVESENTVEATELGASYSGTISIAAGLNAVSGIEAAFAEFQKTYPDVDLDITVTDTVTDFETMMTAWIASDSMPDMYSQQVGTTEQQYAVEGYLMPLDDTGAMDNIVDGDYSKITHDGKFYAFPMTTSISVILCNNAVLKDIGIDLTIDNYPKSMSEFLDLLDKCVAGGVEYPFGIAGADLSAVTAWPFQYMYQVLYGTDKNWYADVLTGDKSWNDAEFVAMFDTYAKLAKYSALDSLGKTNDGLLADFISGDTIFYCQTASSIRSIQELDDESDILLIPSCFTEDAADQTLISGFDEALSITSSAKDPELCAEFLRYVTSPEGSTIYNNETQFIPTTKGCESKMDPSYKIINSIIQEGKLPNSPILSREWISGFKELLKSGCQNWFAGESPQSVADIIAESHTRLMDADPAWVKGFLDKYEYK